MSCAICGAEKCYAAYFAPHPTPSMPHGVRHVEDWCRACVVAGKHVARIAELEKLRKGEQGEEVISG